MAGQPSRLKVAVGIPASYYEKVWIDRNPPKAGEEVKKPDQTALDEIRKEITKDVTAHVARLLPPSPEVKDPDEAGHGDHFPGHQATGVHRPRHAATDIHLADRKLADAGNGGPRARQRQHVALGAPRGSGRASPETSAIAARIPASESKAEEKEEPVEAAAARRLRRMTGIGPSLRDELSELVKEDPDSAASILRTWIGQVN